MFDERLQKADISFTASGDNTVISAPSVGRIAIDFVVLRVEAPTTVQLQDGSTAYGGAYAMDKHDSLSFENSMRNRDGVITLSLGSAFKINSTAAVQVSGFVRYRILDQS